jgi:hypothetical protein
VSLLVIVLFIRGTSVLILIPVASTSPGMSYLMKPFSPSLHLHLPLLINHKVITVLIVALTYCMICLLLTLLLQNTLVQNIMQVLDRYPFWSPNQSYNHWLIIQACRLIRRPEFWSPHQTCKLCLSTTRCRFSRQSRVPLIWYMVGPTQLCTTTMPPCVQTCCLLLLQLLLMAQPCLRQV